MALILHQICYSLYFLFQLTIFFTFLKHYELFILFTNILKFQNLFTINQNIISKKITLKSSFIKSYNFYIIIQKFYTLNLNNIFFSKYD